MPETRNPPLLGSVFDADYSDEPLVLVEQTFTREQAAKKVGITPRHLYRYLKLLMLFSPSLKKLESQTGGLNGSILVEKNIRELATVRTLFKTYRSTEIVIEKLSQIYSGDNYASN